MGGKKGKKSKKKSKRTPASTGRAPSKTKTKAQKMAVANKAKYGGTAKAAAANKAAGKAKAKARHTASQAAKKAASTAKKAAPSKGASISKGTTGIGPVKSGKTYAKAVSNATNAPTKKTTGIGPYADGAKYAAALKASPPKFKEGTKVASHDKPLFKSVPASLDQPASPKYIEGMLQKNINPAKPGDLYGIGTKTAMLGGDNLGGAFGVGSVIGAGLALPSLIKGAVEKGNQLRQNIERKLNPDADKVSAIGNLSGLGISPAVTAPSYLSIKSPESFGAPSQAAVDAAAGITAGGLNVGGSGFTPSKPSGGMGRAISDGTSGIGPVADGNQYARNVIQARFPGASPNSAVFGMDAAQLNQSGGPFAQPGPTPENTPEADYTSYQPGSFYNQSDTNMNPTNFLRSARNVVTTPARMLGINNRLTNMLIPKSNEAIQDARDQRGPRPTLTRRGGGGGARLPVAPLTPEEILLPEQVAAAQTGPAYQQALPEQTGVDPNRLLQIQQEAYARAFNPYNPLTVGGFNPMFRFFGRRTGGMGRGAFRRAFRRD